MAGKHPFQPHPPPAGRAELIAVARPDAAAALRADRAYTRREPAPELLALLSDRGAMLWPVLESAGPGALEADGDPSLARYFFVTAERERDLPALLPLLRDAPGIACAYLKPAGEPPARFSGVGWPGPDVAPGATPDYTPRQGYLGASPAGVDARSAWGHPGGRGKGVRAIDLEWSWRLTHEDFAQSKPELVGGIISDAYGDHGTAVLGVINADENAFGVTGIAPECKVDAFAFSMPTPRAIVEAARMLRPGDLLLLEIHRAGPRHGFKPRPDQSGYVAIEWWPDDLAAIRFATRRGVVVVEAAGNGAEPLNDALYDTPGEGFPSDWHNPYRRAPDDSGAVLVGAGAPPPETHGRSWGADRSRLAFSNHGPCVDAQGWGAEVTTCGYGDLQRGEVDHWYTDRFGGTSSASPMIVGSLAAVQGALRARGLEPLTPAEARSLLRSTGAPQADEPHRPATQRIGNRPDLRALVPAALRLRGEQ